MKTWERRAFWITTFLAALSGLLYGCLRWFGGQNGEFGPEPHPLQGTLQHLHVLLVPALVFFLGWMVRGHGLEGLQFKTRRRSGLAMTALGSVMVFSGYGIQVSVSPELQLGLRWVHGLSTLAFVCMLAVHARSFRVKSRKS